MKTTNWQLLLAALALSLAACGGSDGGSSADATDTQDPTPATDTSTDSTDTDTVDAGDSTDTGSTDTDTVDTTAKRTIVLSNGSATLDGAAVPAYDYVWSLAPDNIDEVFTGTAPSGSDAVYIARDIRYYPSLPTSGFIKVQYDDEQEWAYYYTAAGYTDYIFGTLPAEGYQNSPPSSMMHTASEAYANPVLHITQAGTYTLQGSWTGQINVDLGDDAFTDENAKVTLILDGVTVNCFVAPALIFKNVFEADNTWEEQTSWTYDVDTSNAGANVIISDGSTNTFSGTNVYRLLKPQYKSGSTSVQKKRLKTDGAFYSYVSMNITGGSAGTGVLNISSSYEGLDTDLHLTINGGTVNITADEDGINVNEDGVSVFTLNGGTLNVTSAVGDGIDSNGWIVINDGSGTIQGGTANYGMDSDRGVYIFGGSLNVSSAENVIVNNGSGTIGTTVNMGDMGGGTPPSMF